MTQLLVSVRNVDEAVAAVEGGADIIDVKEPHAGSLGCATPAVILAIGHAVGRMQGRKPPLSLALGELHEWQSGDLTLLRHAIQEIAPQFLKLGLAATCMVPDSASWVAQWRQVRTAIPGSHKWVAVAYADHEQAGSPGVERVLQAAVEESCHILLIDTHTKQGKSLLDEMSLEDLQAIRRKTQEHGLKLALAGSLAKSNLPLLLRIQPDIIAVRGAVCASGDRIGTVSKTLVQEFRFAINQARPSHRSV